MKIEVFGDLFYFRFRFFGKGVAQIFKHHFFAVADDVIHQHVKKAADHVQHAKRQNGDEVDDGKNQYFKQPVSQSEVWFEQVFAVELNDVIYGFVSRVYHFE